MFERPLNRIEPKAGPEHFTSYQMTMPSSTHRRRASCREVDCQARAKGYRAQFDVSTTDGRANAHRVEALKGRRMWSRHVEGPLVTYTFPAGQDCLDVHTVPLEREPFYVVKGGDHRGNPREIAARQLRPADWVDHFANHQAALAAQHERG